MNTDCIFCKIVHGQMPSSIVYEDEKSMAFMDIAPVAKGHVLVIPRMHYDPITATPDEVLAHLIGVVKQVAKAQVKALGANGINVSQANGRCAGQLVPHIHFHVIPRFDGDNKQMKWVSGSYADNDEMASYAETIRAAL